MTYSSFQPFTNPRPFYVDDTGTPIVGATLTFYASGTSTLLATYADASLTTANVNPMVSGSDGMFGPIYMQTGNYRVVLHDQNGVLKFDADPVQGNFWGTIIPYLNKLDQSVKYVSGTYITISSDTNKTIAPQTDTNTISLSGATGNGWEVTILNSYIGGSSTVTTTISPPAGAKINNSTSPYILNGKFAAATFIYDGTSNFWIKTFAMPQTQLLKIGLYTTTGTGSAFTINDPAITLESTVNVVQSNVGAANPLNTSLVSAVEKPIAAAGQASFNTIDSLSNPGQKYIYYIYQN